MKKYDNLSLKKQIQKVSEHGYCVRLITDPSIEVQMASIKQNYWAIQYIEQPYLEVLLSLDHLEYVESKQLDHLTNKERQQIKLRFL